MYNIVKKADRNAKQTKIWDSGYFGTWRTLQNFQFYDFQNSTSLPIFIRFQPNFIVSIFVKSEYKLLLFLMICQKLKIC